MPGVAFYFGFVELGRPLVHSFIKQQYAEDFLLGSVSRSAVTFMLMPVTVIKTRFEVVVNIIIDIHEEISVVVIKETLSRHLLCLEAVRISFLQCFCVKADN